MTDLVVLSDPAITTIPVAESGEPLTDLRGVLAIRVDPRLAEPNGGYARVRAGVADRLVAAQTLLPPGIRLLVVEGHRSLAVQTAQFDVHVRMLRRRRPDWEPQRLRWEASRYICPPEVAPHVAGAAVDVTLCDVDGGELWLGTEVGDIATRLCHTSAAGVDGRARYHREVLCAALSAAGLVNYPSQWWHWSYGDRYWAYVSMAAAARYDQIEE